MNYDDRLKFDRLNSLKGRRIRYSLIQVFKNFEESYFENFENFQRNFEEIKHFRGLNFALNRQRSNGNSF